MKKILIITLVMLFGCSRLPWKDEVIEEESFEQEEVEVEQLYGLHSMQGAEIKAQSNNIDYLESKIDSISLDVASIMELLKNLQNQISNTQETLIDNQAASNDTSDINVVGDMAQLQMKVKLNKDRVDRYTMYFDSVRFDMNQRYVVLDNEVSTMKKALIEYMSSSNEDFLDSGIPEMSDQEFRERYAKYYKSYINEDYDLSIRGFQELLMSNKKHELSENCQYWMGESYFAKGEYDVALDAFYKVFDYPNEKKEDDAQLKIGICYIKLEDTIRAKKELQKYIDQFPMGEFVSKAKSYLRQLD